MGHGLRDRPFGDGPSCVGTDCGDEYTRERPAIEVDSCLSSRSVTRVLERVFQQHGKPESLCCDDGPEFTSWHFLARSEVQQIRLIHVQPGRSMQNGRMVSFNGRLRDELLLDLDGSFGADSTKEVGDLGIQRSALGAAFSLATRLRGARHWHDSARVLGPRDRVQPSRVVFGA